MTPEARQKNHLWFCLVAAAPRLLVVAKRVLDGEILSRAARAELQDAVDQCEGRSPQLLGKEG